MKESYSPLVSVVIPVYNGYPYLSEAIDSVLEQTYKNIEIIVINDGSPDDGKTEEIALSYGNKIKYYSKVNGGVSSALNYGIKKMQGEWFSWLSHDDLYQKNKIEKQILAVQELENKRCVVRCKTARIDKDGKSIFGRAGRDITGIIDSSRMMKEHLINKASLYGCSLLIHKDIINECGYFDDNLRMVQDEDYWIRIMFHNYLFLSIPDELVKIRIHEGQVTNRLSDRFAPEIKILADKVLKYYDENPKENYDKLITFVCKQAMEGRHNLKNYLVEEISKRNRMSVKQLSIIEGYTIYGFFYANVKRIYKMLIIKRHQKG